MIAFPSAKINLGLKVLEKRADGFHNIETIFYPVKLSDVLEIVPAVDGLFSFESTGLPVPGAKEDNLCLRAFSLLSADFHLPPVKIHLHKVIPVGGGLGGGSSDGAHTIRLLDNLFLLGLSDAQMMLYAGNLGSDCAFFILNQPVFAVNKGDVFEPLGLDLSDYRIEIVSPGIHVSTAEAYAMIDLRGESLKTGPSLKELISLPVKEWKNFLVNDFEKPVFDKYPELESLKQDLYEKGAIYASMTGSGSSIFGIFTS
jgi:4-diphosphocytidyl-2-C-methyl-D-erythritol kinase